MNFAVLAMLQKDPDQRHDRELEFPDMTRDFIFRSVPPTSNMPSASLAGGPRIRAGPSRRIWLGWYSPSPAALAATWTI